MTIKWTLSFVKSTFNFQNKSVPFIHTQFKKGPASLVIMCFTVTSYSRMLLTQEKSFPTSLSHSLATFYTTLTCLCRKLQIKLIKMVYLMISNILLSLFSLLKLKWSKTQRIFDSHSMRCYRSLVVILPSYSGSLASVLAVFRSIALTTQWSRSCIQPNPPKMTRIMMIVISKILKTKITATVHKWIPF